MDHAAAWPAYPPETASSRSVVLRSGLSMRWGHLEETFLPLGPSNDSVAIFAFVIDGNDWQSGPDDSRKTAPAGASSGRMLFFSAAHPPSGLGSATAPFHVALAASKIALDDLFVADRTHDLARSRLGAAQTGPNFIELELTPAARFSVESIRRCPFAGACRDLALTARGLDLLAEFISALDRVDEPIATSHLPLDHTLAQVRAAAGRLQAGLDHPPSIAELAGTVGLSESTLKRGFRQLYHTTPFGYLRARRMEHARELLATGKTTVLEAAAYVGYSNPSNFAAAFRKQFGVNPKTFQMSARR